MVGNPKDIPRSMTMERILSGLLMAKFPAGFNCNRYSRRFIQRQDAEMPVKDPMINFAPAELIEDQRLVAVE